MGYAKNLLLALRPGTQNYKALEYLVTNSTITVQDMTTKLHINSPRDIIRNLRGKGVDIVSVQRRSPSGKVFIEYKLVDHDD